MKKILMLLFCLLLIGSLCFKVSAHPGRTDSNGGHYNHSTGEYHYHHGYSEHQHPNGICPYEENTNTNSNNKNFSISFFRQIPEPIIVLIIGIVLSIMLTLIIAIKEKIEILLYKRRRKKYTPEAHEAIQSEPQKRKRNILTIILALMVVLLLLAVGMLTNEIYSLKRENASLTNNLERIKQYAPNYYMDENGNVIKIH